MGRVLTYKQECFRYFVRDFPHAPIQCLFVLLPSPLTDSELAETSELENFNDFINGSFVLAQESFVIKNAMAHLITMKYTRCQLRVDEVPIHLLRGQKRNETLDHCLRLALLQPHGAKNNRTLSRCVCLYLMKWIGTSSKCDSRCVYSVVTTSLLVFTDVIIADMLI